MARIRLPSQNLSRAFLEVVEQSAIAAARTMGIGDREFSDQAAVEVMRRIMDSVPMKGTIVIGEGERDQAPMLYIGEKVGKHKDIVEGEPDIHEVDIAVDPLEGTNLCATGAPGAITVLASSEKGGLLNAPDCYMEKIIVGPACRGKVDLDLPVSENLKRIARALDRDVDDLAIVVLNRPRHEKLIREIREAGARIRLIGDGDLSTALATTHEPAGVDLLMGIGGAAQGVLAAAALRCIGGEIQGRFRPRNEDEAKQLHDLDIHDFRKKYGTQELAGGNVMFAATGVTTGGYLTGVRFYSGGAMTNSVVVRSETRTLRLLETFHHFEQHPEY